MVRTTPPPVRFLASFSALALLLLPLILLACGFAEPIDPPTRKPLDRASAETDRWALEALYEATGGADWRNSENWLTDTPLNEWFGIVTDDDGRVTEINLDENGLAGEISSEIGSLDRLVSLNLEVNQLTGRIPVALNYLGGLQELYLANNDFSGGIPEELGYLKNLVRLDLSDNRLSGGILEELGYLGNLVRLDLSGNRLSGGIPEELGYLENLLRLKLAGNPRLTGCVPDSLARRLDTSSDLGGVPVCDELALGVPTATIAPEEIPEPTDTPPGPTAKAEPTLATPTPDSTDTPSGPTATAEPTLATPTPDSTDTPPGPTATPEPTLLAPTPDSTDTPPGPPATPVPIIVVAVPLPTATPVPPQSLESYARRNAGGPGAIYVGDLSQLVGPAQIQDLGDDSGNVPLDALERHGWIYESDYYRELLDKAEITGSTPLTSSGRQIYIDFVCVDRALPACKLIESYFVPNVLERTNGLVRFQVRSLPELGVAGSDTLNLVSTGTLSGATIFGRYAAGDIPAIDVQSLWGVYSFREESYQAATSMVGDLDRLIEEWTDGGVIFSHSWYSGNDQYLFCRDSRESSRGFRGKKTRSHSASLSDWINGMGAEA